MDIIISDQKMERRCNINVKTWGSKCRCKYSILLYNWWPPISIILLNNFLIKNNSYRTGWRVGVWAGGQACTVADKCWARTIKRPEHCTKCIKVRYATGRCATGRCATDQPEKYMLGMNEMVAHIISFLCLKYMFWTIFWSLSTSSVRKQF